MKNMYKYISLILIFIIGVGKYLPIIYFPNFLNSLYFNYGALIMALSFICIVLFVLKWNLKLFYKLLFIVLPILTILLSSKIHDFNNSIIIKYNKNVSEFKNPILGVKIDTTSRLGQTAFVFNKRFGVYDALVYSHLHGLNENSWEFKNENSYYKIYDKDWWWYKHND